MTILYAALMELRTKSTDQPANETEIMNRPSFIEQPRRHLVAQRDSRSDIDNACAVEVYETHSDVALWWAMSITLAVSLIAGLAAIVVAFL